MAEGSAASATVEARRPHGGWRLKLFQSGGSGAAAANTMMEEYETALRAIMVEGHGPVEGLLAAVYFGDVDETKEGYLKYQLLRLGAGSDEEGPLEAASDDDWGADPVAAFEASRRQKVKAQGGSCNHTQQPGGMPALHAVYFVVRALEVALVGREQEPGPQHGRVQAALPVAVSPQT